MKKNSEQTKLNIGLIGNPNTGKTSLLNQLTGFNLHVGNWPGKTVERKEGFINHAGRQLKIVDLPGTYSIAPYSEEEKIARDFIMSKEPDVIVQIIDVNNLVRNLLMTMEVLGLKKKVVLAFNFNKEAKSRGIKIDTKKIEEVLQVPIVEIEANTGKNVKDLLNKIIKIADAPIKTPAFIKEFVKQNKEISHTTSIEFLQKEISPLVLTKETSTKTEQVDSFILNKYTAFPIFILAIIVMFWCTFQLSMPFVDLIALFLNRIAEYISYLNLPEFIQSFLINGMIGGVGTVLSFTPIIFIFYFFISLFEDSGYLARTIVLVDKLFQKLGLSGYTYIPMILGFGCNVPAILTTRIIKDKRERMIARFLVPFIPCSAYIPLNMFLAKIFFRENAVWAVVALYLISVIIALCIGLILSKFVYKTGEHPFAMELFPYRMPSLKNILKRCWYQSTTFIKKTGTTIFFFILLVWLLASLPIGVEYSSGESILGMIGKLTVPLFEPLGFGHYIYTATLIFGFVAKEMFLALLGTLAGTGVEGLQSTLTQQLSVAGAFSFLVFAHLYMPCIATCAILRKESSTRFLLGRIITSLILAWIISFCIYQISYYIF